MSGDLFPKEFPLSVTEETRFGVEGKRYYKLLLTIHAQLQSPGTVCCSCIRTGREFCPVHWLEYDLERLKDAYKRGCEFMEKRLKEKNDG